jgi:hypothetical protein
MAIQMSIQSMQISSSETKRSIPVETVAGEVVLESPEENNRRFQTEKIAAAAAAEKRMMAGSESTSNVVKREKEEVEELEDGRIVSKELSIEEVNELFVAVFGYEVSKGILEQWCNQGIRYIFFNMCGYFTIIRNFNC